MPKDLVLGPILTPLPPPPPQKIFFLGFYLYQMSHIVASYYCMQFQRKLIHQTWENDKKPSFGPNFGPFGTNSGLQNIFSKIWLRQSLDIMVSYHHVQCHKNLMIQPWENLVMDRQPDGQTNKWIGGQTNGWMDRQTDRRTDKRIDQQTNRWEWFQRTLAD